MQAILFQIGKFPQKSFKGPPGLHPVDIAGADGIAVDRIAGSQIEGDGVMFAEQVQKSPALVRKTTEHAHVPQDREDMPGVAARCSPAGLACLQHGDWNTRFR